MISAIAIISQDRGLGKDNHLLFHIPGELPRLKQITMGHPLIMGRKTHESIGKPLPGRLNIVVSRRGGQDIPGALIFVDSLEKAMEIAKESEESRFKNVILGNKVTPESQEDAGQTSMTSNEQEVFILGGGQIFTEALPLTDRLYLTIVDATVPADVFFPEYEDQFTKIIKKTEKADWEYPYRFVTLERE